MDLGVGGSHDLYYLLAIIDFDHQSWEAFDQITSWHYSQCSNSIGIN